MADGNATRWGEHMGVPKQLIEIDGEMLLVRTIKQLLERGISELYVTTHDPRIASVAKEYGATVYEPSGNDTEVGKFLSPIEIWAENGSETLFVYGDAYFTDAVMDKMVKLPSTGFSGFMFFGRNSASKDSGKDYGEIYALKMSDHSQLIESGNVVRNMVKSGKLTRGGAWELYRHMVGLDINAKEVLGHFVHITNDITEDFDFPKDLDRWLKATEGVRHGSKASGEVAKGTKVLLAIPNLGHLHVSLVSIILMWINSRPKGIDEVHIFTPTNVRPHDAARNLVVKHFLENTDCTHLFFIDADTIPPLDALQKLLEANKPVISGCTPTMRLDQYTDEQKVQFMIMRHGIDTRGKEGIITVWGEGVEPIDYTGGSCLLIKREVLEKLPKPCFKFEYNDDGLVARGEDIHFCNLLAAQGVPLYAHFDVVCNHSKEIVL